MAGDITAKYGSNCALTLTLASLGFSDNLVARESTHVDNDMSAALALDALVTVRCEVGTVAAPNYIGVYAYGSVGTRSAAGGYSGKATGTDAAYGPGTVAHQCIRMLKLIGVIPTYTNSIKCEGGPFSVASAFGGVLPEKWGIVVQNASGAALTASTVDNCAVYQIVYAQYT